VVLFQHRQRCGWNADVAGSAGVRVVCLSLLLGGEDGVSVFLTSIKQYFKIIFQQNEINTIKHS